MSFDTIANLTTCESATIQWFYAGPPTAMTLRVTNVGVDQVALPPAPSTTSSTSVTSTPPPLENGRDRRAVPFVDMVISDRVNPSSLSFRWSSVNVASGSYILQAEIAEEDFLQESPVFHVLTGRNTACLVVNPSTSTTTSGASTSSGTGPSSPPAQTSGSWVPGGVGGSSRNPINTGAIIGIVLGVLAMTIVGVGAYFFVRNRRRKEQTGFGGGKNWNHLNSTDSRGGLMPATLVGNQKRGSRRISSSQRRANYPTGSSTGHMTKSSQDDIAEKELGSTDYSSRKNSVASYDSNAMALSTLPSLHLHNNPSHGYEQGDLPSPKRRRPSSSDPTAANVAVRRSSSDKRPSRPYLPTIESNNNSLSGTPSLDGTSFSHNAYEMQPPSSPSPMNADLKRTNRQSFGRKRKPVPVYDPSSESPLQPSPPSPMPSTPTSSTPLDSRSYQSHDVGYMHQPQPQAPNLGSSVGHYSTRMAAGNGKSRPGTPDASELLHKSSLGIDGKPVHYLMPDLPADQR